MLVLVRSLSYTPCASFREKSYTPDTILLRSFSCTPNDSFSLLFRPNVGCCFLFCFYTPDASFSEEFVLHALR